MLGRSWIRTQDYWFVVRCTTIEPPLLLNWATSPPDWATSPPGLLRTLHKIAHTDIVRVLFRGLDFSLKTTFIPPPFCKWYFLPYFVFILQFYFPFSHFLPLSSFFSPLSSFFFNIFPFFSSPFHIFPPNNIGWYFFPGGVGYFPLVLLIPYDHLPEGIETLQSSRQSELDNP